jgi:galactokinase
LANSEYNTRKLECEKGIELMQVQFPNINSLREATLEILDATVRPAVFPKVYNRCKYVIQEIDRTQLAAIDLQNNDLEQFGKKMFATHEGLSQLYEVSCPELDLLAQWAKEETSIIGARMMGGGFGGCTINLIQKDKAASVIETITDKYFNHTGKKLVSYIVQAEEGAHIV